MSKNNLYNFKNPIRHFLRIDDIMVDLQNINVRNLSWTVPIKFKIRKDREKFRILKLPNILNFSFALKEFQSQQHFENIPELDEHKRIAPNLETGDFSSNSFSISLEDDFKHLCIYDKLIILDIKSFYDRIYTHELGLLNDTPLTNMNKGATNGLIMGNYISLYFAEKYLTNISNDIESRISDENIDCYYSYYSDDFYFFCNEKDELLIKKIFDEVLVVYDMERNETKDQTWSYSMYSDYNLVEKYWKTIISNCKKREKDTEKKQMENGEELNKQFYFINQLVYRNAKLKDERLQRIFIINFFKSTYFHELNMNDFFLQEFNQHQLCFLFRLCPEIMLYAIPKFKIFPYFLEEHFKTFLSVGFKKSLCHNFFEEQLYFYYAIKVLGFETILNESVNAVFNCGNQILISYYIKDDLFNQEQIEDLRRRNDEMYWFQNYHLILFNKSNLDLKESIQEYLIPNYARGGQVETYLNFYYNNLNNDISIINSIDFVTESVGYYINLKINERRQNDF